MKKFIAERINCINGTLEDLNQKVKKFRCLFSKERRKNIELAG